MLATDTVINVLAAGAAKLEDHMESLQPAPQASLPKQARVVSRHGGFQEKNTQLVGTRPLWLSPDRELTVMYPTYMYKALQLAEREMMARHPLAGNEELRSFYAYAGALKSFWGSVVGDERPAHISELEVRLGLLSPRYAESEQVIGKYLHRVLMGAFFKGAGYAYMRGDRPIERKDLDAMVADWVGRAQQRRPVGILRRLAAVVRWVLGRE